jgi:hypothetical protein
VRHDLYDINRKGKVFDIEKMISELYKNSPGVNTANGLGDLQSLQNAIKLAGEDIVGTLENWAFRLVSEKWPYRMLPRIHKPQELLPCIEKIPTTFPVERQALHYCDGAMALQHNHKGSIQDITTQEREILPLTWTCKFCFLEISDYRRASMAWDMGAWNSLGMSHVVACVSYTDRRAAFKCIDCDELELRKIYADPATFLQHIKVHQDERQQARMNKSSTYKRDGPDGRRIPASAYETENSLDKHRPIFHDDDPEGHNLERDIGKGLGEEISDIASDWDAPDVLKRHDQVSPAVSEQGIDRNGGGSDTDEEVSSVSSEEYQQRWGDSQTTLVPTFAKVMRARRFVNGEPEERKVGKAKETPVLHRNSEMRQLDNDRVQQESINSRNAERHTMHRNHSNQGLNGSAIQPVLHENLPRVSPSTSVRGEEAGKELAHELEPTPVELSYSTTNIDPERTVDVLPAAGSERAPKVEASKIAQIAREDAATGNKIVKAPITTEVRRDLVPELEGANHFQNRNTTPIPPAERRPVQTGVPAHNMTTTVPAPKTAETNVVDSGKSHDRADRTNSPKPQTQVARDQQEKEQMAKSATPPARVHARSSSTLLDDSSTTAPVSQAKVLHNFQARDSRELTISSGEILEIVRKRDSSMSSLSPISRYTNDVADWWMCLNRSTQAHGLVPTAYVQELPPAQGQLQTQQPVQTQPPQSADRQRTTLKPEEKKFAGVPRKLIPGSWS